MKGITAAFPDANPRIMLVSSLPVDSDVQAGLQRFILHTVQVCISIDDAIRDFAVAEFNIVLIDECFPPADIVRCIASLRMENPEMVIPIVLLLQSASSPSLSDYLNAGADHFLARPFQADLLVAKLRLSNQIRLMQATLRHQSDQIRLHNEHLLREQQVAKRIYDNITSQGGCLNAENIRYFMSPLVMFNGDILLAAMRPSGNMLILLGDFTGHGLPAAIGAIPLSAAFYGMANKGFAPEDILREINQKVKAALPVGFFCCACMAELDFHEQTLLFWNGGMPDAILHSPANGIMPLPSTHLALGIVDSRQFDAGFTRYPMLQGDRLFLWTDGIIEATNCDGEMFGDAGIHQVFAANTDPSVLLHELCVAVDEFIGDSSNDDVSVVEVRMVPPGSLVATSPAAVQQTTQSAPTDWSMSFGMAASAVRAGTPIQMILNLLMEVPGLRQHSSSLFTILTELFSNALEHGILGLSSELKHSLNGFVEYYAERDRRLQSVAEGELTFSLQHQGLDDGGILTIRLRDSGPGFDHHQSPALPVSDRQLAGRGVALVRQLCDSVTYHGCGNEVSAVFRWHHY